MDELVVMKNGEAVFKLAVPKSRGYRLYEAWREMKKAENERKTVELTRKLFPWLFNPFAERPDGDGTDPIDPVEIVLSEHLRTGENLVTVDGRTTTLDAPAGESVFDD